MTTSARWAFGSIALTAACASPPRATPTVKAEVVTVAPAAAAPVEVAPDPAPVATSVEAARVADPCRGRSFDLDALPKACASREAYRAPASLVATLAADGPVAPGGEVAVTLTVTNPSKEDAELVVSSSCAFLELQAFKGNVRADYVNPSCGFGRGCGRATYRLTLEPGGVIVKHLRYRARVQTFGQDCTSKESPLPPGSYVLRLDSSADFALHALVADLRAPLVVAR